MSSLTVPTMDLPGPARPHAVYYLLTLSMIAAFGGFAIGLTFAPCHASMCVEQFFPLQARIHIAAFYGLLIVVTLLLTFRVLFKSIHKLSNLYISNIVWPILGKRISVGGLLFVVLTGIMTFGSVGYWCSAEYKWWNDRGVLVNYTTYTYRLAWTGITGHWCDISIGLVALPVGRNSILGRLFHLHVSTFLFAHKLLAYALFLGSLVHGIMYYTFVGTSASGSSAVADAFPVDNPTISSAEAAVRGPISFLVLPTGVISFAMIMAVTVSSLPALRRRSYNAFYFIHIVLAVMIVILTCLHASTNFYFLLPGIVLGISDWVRRVSHSLKKKSTAVVEDAGSGWYRVRLPQEKIADTQDVEKSQIDMVASTLGSPLQTYYVNFPTVSKLQIHPFTAAVLETPTAGSTLLYQKAPERKKAKDTNKEWTWKLSALVDEAENRNIAIPVRIEGPYSPIVPELYEADHILLVVGGTGITGALSISHWWAHNFKSTTSKSKTLRLVWTYRTPETAQIPEVQQQLQAVMTADCNMEFVKHVTAYAGRLDLGTQVGNFLGDGIQTGRVWVYASGPEGLLAGVEDACIRQKNVLRNTRGLDGGRSVTAFDWYIARWTL
ncbi:hypothetical protein MMC11_008908 [Xylographa trunciseda]|nr:hypothetical protein [Xylographa trunciseda]